MIKILFLGTPDFVKPIKDALAEHFDLTDKIEEAQLLVVAAYGKILTKEELSTPKYGGLNIHPSLLPKYRGPSPIQQTILNGDTEGGVTIMKMDEEVDHGPILTQEKINISKEDTFQNLAEKMFKLGGELLVKLIPDYISGGTKALTQNDNQATFCDRITKKDGYFEMDNLPPLDKLDRMIRAYYPWPTAWTRWRGKIVKFLPLGLVQMEGKKPTKLENFLNGYPDFPIKRLD